ncbi:MAG: hypothetical protein HOL01_04940 [Planctomycetaceae bacterium]|nr:hypothetical protein [Planctomycetaceae bacterium]MBT6483324.1 hypothetical protein [Planctomycetaceae bacterium]MBT6493881.1 hypothetical protein [Planctomycetaceae bacterium]
MKDNVIQGISVLVGVLIGAGVGWSVVDEPIPGLLAGGVGGMLVGVFGSGLYLMIYRAMKHVRKDHD